ncbi:MAG: hypothetical protein HOP21_04120 [Methylotenera sp.]|nr:hypothetical protein [Methylotenera sp.]
MLKKYDFLTSLQCAILLIGTVLSSHVLAAGYVTDNQSKCQVWASNTLNKADYRLRYQGDCKAGRAEGKGRAEWLYHYTEDKLAYTWEGRFKNGIFIGDQPVEGNVEGESSRSIYLVEMGQLPNAKIVFVSTSENALPMDLCAVEQIAVAIDQKIKDEDEESVNFLLRNAGEHYRTSCPKVNNSSFLIKAYRPPLALNKAGYLPEPFAGVKFSPLKSGEDAYSEYSNIAALKLKIATQQKAHQEKLAEIRKRFIDFSRTNEVESWVTSGNLDKNPFIWEGKTIALVVRLERMISPSLALVRGVNANYSERSRLLLNNVTPEFFTDKDTIVVVRVGKRNNSATLDEALTTSLIGTTNLDFITGQPCEKELCKDWFSWKNADETINWNKPLRYVAP